MQETLDKTSLAGAVAGDRVNLERAVTAENASAATSSRATSTASGSSYAAAQRALEDRRGLPAGRPGPLRRPQGRHRRRRRLAHRHRRARRPFTVSLIPETLARTTLGTRAPGDRVNLETDVIARHVEKLLTRLPPRSRLDDGLSRPHGQHRRAVADIRAGKPVVVVDDEDRENEGDLIFAAAKATPELLAFTIRHTSGVVCVPMPGRGSTGSTCR